MKILLLLGSNRKNLYSFQDEDGKINFEEFCEVVGNTDIHKKMVVDV